MDIPKTRGTILVVDDEADTLFFISKTCQIFGYDAMTALSGMEALKIIEECGTKLTLVVLDLYMPGMGGMEVLKSIRKYHPDLPVIILTALHNEQENCEKIGVEAFIKKPYSLKELYAKIEAVVKQKDEENEEVNVEPGMEPCAKILIVDDEPEVCDILKSALEEDVGDAHFEVLVAISGEEALKKSLEFEPDIGIIDVKMPHMWGDELIDRFKRGEGHAPKDFIIYTSVADPIQLKNAKKLGYKFFQKPTNLEALVATLKRLCVRHNLLRKR